jgi:hypothetical protein
MRWLVAILALLVVLFLVGYFRIEGGVMSLGQTVLDSTLQWVKNATGSAITAIAALLLLLRAIQNGRVETVVPLVVALLAGLELVKPDWPTTPRSGAAVSRFFRTHAFLAAVQYGGSSRRNP